MVVCDENLETEQKKGKCGLARYFFTNNSKENKYEYLLWYLDI